jgi:MFS family permease
MIDAITRKHQQVRDLYLSVQGNARVIVITEGIAAISFQWFRTYFPLYMLALHVNEVQIGLLESVLILTQLISTLLGGYVADRLGRKRTLVTFDIICWGVPMFLYAIARNPWYFLVGRVINGFVYIVVPSFQCLFVEDVPNADRAAVFGTLQFLTSGARLLAPVAGWLVAWQGIVPAGRMIAGICMVSSISIALARQLLLRETSMGRVRMVDTAGLTPSQMVQEYLSAIRTLVEGREMRTFLAVRSLVAFKTVMWTTYATIYLTDERGIGLSASSIAILPSLAALITMAMTLMSAARLQTQRVFGSLILGQILSIIAAVSFALSPAGTLGLAIVWAVVEAAGMALFQPANRSYWANIVGNRERALVFSASAAVMSLCTLPAGPLAGVLYTRYPKGPFLLGIAMQATALALTLALRREDPSSS